MPTAIAYRRAPLVDPALVPLSDAAVHADGLQKQLTDLALGLVDLNRMSPLDAALATKLGGYTETPPFPDVEAAAGLLPNEPERFAALLRAASMLAAMERDKQAMLRVLGGMRAFLDALGELNEEQLFACGADILRLAVDLYRRTGQPFLLSLMESLRSRLPDVSGLMHMFPFQREYRPETGAHTPDEEAYYARMQRFATGKGTADALAMTALIAQYSGSGRDAAAGKAGLTALSRYHGMPSGAFSADPFLAGRDPARAVELPAACAQAEAYFDALCQSGDAAMADRLEMLLVNVLPDLLTPDGVRSLSPTNRLAGDESCQAQSPEPDEVSALLRALYAIRRSVWMSQDDDTLAYALPVAVKRTGTVSGVFQREITIRVECRQAVPATLRLRVPGYADGAQISVNGARPQAVAQGEWHSLRRTYQNGDIITLRLGLSPRLETGYRGSVSLYVGARLMALALPDENVAWRYAIHSGNPITPVEEDGAPYALAAACEAPMWKEKAGFILPPPQGVPAGPAYELTLIPFAGTGGRIASFPCVVER